MTNEPVFEGNQSLLALIKQGMQVYDRQGDRIGTVELVHFGAEERHGTGAATPSQPGERDKTLVDAFWGAFDIDRVPEALKSRLFQQGFVRVDAAGLFAADRYVMPGQIARVDDDAVHLRVDRKELVHG